MIRFLFRLLLLLALLAGVLAAAHLVTPWPGAMALRWALDREAQAAMAALAPRVPAGLVETRGVADPADPDTGFDLILPPGEPPVGGWPVVVWVHGGAWVSGSPRNVGNYVRLLAAGAEAAAMVVSYTPAPEARHPVPARQVNAALGWLAREGPARGLAIDRVVLAGDGAGAQIAAQTAIALVDPAYAARLRLAPALPAYGLRGLVLFCGSYDAATLPEGGLAGQVMDLAMRAHFGRNDWRAAPDLAEFSIPANLPDGLPPAFVSAGNADPLLPQSQALVRAMEAKGLAVETLFFAENHRPPLIHEYQMDLSHAAGEQALARAVGFLRRAFGAF